MGTAQDLHGRTARGLPITAHVMEEDLLCPQTLFAGFAPLGALRPRYKLS